MEIVEIPVPSIRDDSRARPVTPAVAEQLARDIAARGLRTPVEVARAAGGAYRLVSGGHRLAAFRVLGRDTIPAVVVRGSALELRRDELLENLARNELSMLERAQFLAELKRVYQEIHPAAKNGGDRKSIDFKKENQSANLADWSGEVARRGDWSIRTIERVTRIGERLSPEAADLLRGTPFEDNQSELDALAKIPRADQEATAALVVGKGAGRTIRQAIAINQGGAKIVDPEAKSLQGLMDRWNRANSRVRSRFLDWVAEQGEIA